MPNFGAPKRRGSSGSADELESLFGDESPNGALNGSFMEQVIDNDQPSQSQESVSENTEQKEMCRDVFLTSSIDGAISLWDRRQEGIIARLAAGPKGTPPWCMSVFSRRDVAKVGLLGNKWRLHICRTAKRDGRRILHA